MHLPPSRLSRRRNMYDISVLHTCKSRKIHLLLSICIADCVDVPRPALGRSLDLSSLRNKGEVCMLARCNECDRSCPIRTEGNPVPNERPYTGRHFGRRELRVCCCWHPRRSSASTVTGVLRRAGLPLLPQRFDLDAHSSEVVCRQDV